MCNNHHDVSGNSANPEPGNQNVPTQQESAEMKQEFKTFWHQYGIDTPLPAHLAQLAADNSLEHGEAIKEFESDSTHLPLLVLDPDAQEAVLSDIQERAEKYGFNVDESNAAECIRESAALVGCDELADSLVKCLVPQAIARISGDTEDAEDQVADPAQLMRQQALTLLAAAERLDGMKLYPIISAIHDETDGISCFSGLTWATHAPTLVEACPVLELEAPPQADDKSQKLAVEAPVPLWQIAGTMPASRLASYFEKE
jgi:hypothetical protein